jgi:hypothetical protein
MYGMNRILALPEMGLGCCCRGWIYSAECFYGISGRIMCFMIASDIPTRTCRIHACTMYSRGAGHAPIIANRNTQRIFATFWRNRLQSNFSSDGIIKCTKPSVCFQYEKEAEEDTPKPLLILLKKSGGRFAK